MEDALILTNVTKRYRTVTAVERLSFSVARREIFALLGPNGAGKTTTVRMIQGILAPDEGEIAFGIDGARGHCRPGLGYLPEDRGLYRDPPIGRILEVFGRMRGMGRAASRPSSASYSTARISPVPGRFTHRLSALNGSPAAMSRIVTTEA